ncbi:MAG: RNA-binding S4 domain-containing protein [Deltaproteobacteria bacterium]|nr:MAG: RNA-binding S4 domain-containing protein [Deltaproteobacteria bacterium]
MVGHGRRDVTCRPRLLATLDDVTGTDFDVEVRLDRWLWAARFFRTRALAQRACAAGHVKVDGATAKPGRRVRPGQRLSILTPGGLRIVEIAAVAERRGPASVARTLYVDHTPPPPEPPPGAPPVVHPRGAGRPTKRDRRRLARLKGKL